MQWLINQNCAFARSGNSNLRCKKKCDKYGLRCYKSCDHVSQHKFTPKHLLSPSTLFRVISDLTSGAIKSRAGLDNTDVLKGHENFEQMRSLVSTLASLFGGETGNTKKEELLHKISEVQEFHRLNFTGTLILMTGICMHALVCTVDSMMKMTILLNALIVISIKMLCPVKNAKIASN